MTDTEIKALVRNRDGFACRKCGMTSEEHYKQYDKQLDVHRLLPGAPYTIEGCVTLCRSCHGKMPKNVEDACFGDPNETGIVILYLNLFASNDSRLFEIVKRSVGGDVYKATKGTDLLATS